MQRIIVNGLETEVKTFGTPNSTPVIMMFGNAVEKAGWHIWEYNDSLKRLSRDNYVIAYNRRGHGYTPFLSGNIDDLADDLIALMDALNIPKAIVVSLSAGTYIAGRALTLHPERFISSVFIVPHSHAEGLSPASVMMKKMNIDSATATPEEMKRTTDALWAPMTPDSIKAARENWYSEQFGTIPEISMEQCGIAYKAIGTFDNREGFSKVSVPTIVFSGKYDNCNSPEIGKEIASLIQGAEYVEMPKSGHMMFFEENEALIDALNAYLARFRA